MGKYPIATPIVKYSWLGFKTRTSREISELAEPIHNISGRVLFSEQPGDSFTLSRLPLRISFSPEMVSDSLTYAPGLFSIVLALETVFRSSSDSSSRPIHAVEAAYSTRTCTSVVFGQLVKACRWPAPHEGGYAAKELWSHLAQEIS
jgi:hypothetical protein